MAANTLAGIPARSRPDACVPHVVHTDRRYLALLHLGLHAGEVNRTENIASLRADLRVVESELANPPSYANPADLERLRRSLVRKMETAGA